jgi:hypothetical protein
MLSILNSTRWVADVWLWGFRCPRWDQLGSFTTESSWCFFCLMTINETMFHAPGNKISSIKDTQLQTLKKRENMWWVIVSSHFLGIGTLEKSTVHLQIEVDAVWTCFFFGNPTQTWAVFEPPPLLVDHGFVACPNPEFSSFRESTAYYILRYSNMACWTM